MFTNLNTLINCRLDDNDFRKKKDIKFYMNAFKFRKLKGKIFDRNRLASQFIIYIIKRRKRCVP